MGELGEVGRDRRGTLLRVDLRSEQRLQLLTIDTLDLPFTVANEGLGWNPLL